MVAPERTAPIAGCAIVCAVDLVLDLVLGFLPALLVALGLALILVVAWVALPLANRKHHPLLTDEDLTGDPESDRPPVHNKGQARPDAEAPGQ